MTADMIGGGNKAPLGCNPTGLVTGGVNLGAYPSELIPFEIRFSDVARRFRRVSWESEGITPQTFAERMKEIVEKYDQDPETMHEEADALICKVLRGLGYSDGVSIFVSAEKWYA